MVKPALKQPGAGEKQCRVVKNIPSYRVRIPFCMNIFFHAIIV
jgi:hypothetical protein